MYIPIQVWHIMKVTGKVFGEHPMMQIPNTDNQLDSLQLIEEVSEHVGVNNPQITDSSRRLPFSLGQQAS